MMGRPPKPKKLRKNVPFCILLTAEQKRLIEEAAQSVQMEMSTWARQIITEAAQAMVGKRGQEDEE